MRIPPACHSLPPWIIAAAIFAGCSSPEVANVGTDITVGDEWVLEAAPPGIGAVEGNAAEVLSWPMDPLLFDGGIVLANAHEEIRVYRRSGELVGRFGREGEGPGEFRQLRGLRSLDNDSLLAALDVASQRITLFDLDGSVQATVRTPFSLDPAAGWALLGSERLIGLRYTIPNTSRPGPRAVRDTTDLILFSVSGRILNRKDGIPGRSSLITPLSTWKGLPFGPSTRLAASRGRVAVSTGSRLLIYGPDLRLATTLRFPSRARVTEGLLDAWEEERLRDLEAMIGEPVRGQLWPTGYERVVPERIPSFARVRVDDSGCVWVSRYRLPGEREIEWLVIDPTTARAARLKVPADWALSDIRGHEVVGITRDSLGVARIVRYLVRRSDGDDRYYCG